MLFEASEGVARITLNRPRVVNSLNRQMAQELQDAIGKVAVDDALRVLLLTARGDGFCAGQDLKEVLPKKGEAAPVLGETVRISYNPIILALRNLEKPIICAVNGVAAGAGANIAFACDLVIASEKAEFVQSFAAIGLVPDSGGTFMLPRLIGLPRATAFAMLGEKMKAKEAERIGLIYRAAPHTTYMQEAEELAKRMAVQPTRGFGLTKRAFNQAMGNTLEQQLELEAELQSELGAGYDYNEGVAAFLEKRKPVYKGK